MRCAAILFHPARTEEALVLADTFSPRVEVAAVDLLLLDISGMERLWPEESRLARALQAKFREADFQAWAAIASNRCIAGLMAKGLARTPHAPHADDENIVVIPEEMEMERLALLPLDLLPSSETAAQALQRWGLRTLGDLSSLSMHDLVERLGQEGLRLHRLACGQEDLPLAPWNPPEVFEAFFAFEWPIESSEPLSFTLHQLLERLCARLNRSLQSAEAVEFTLPLADRTVYHRLLRFGAPLKDAATIGSLLRLRLETDPPQAAIASVHLRLHPTPSRAMQYGLLDPPVPAPEILARTLARLVALAGERNVGSPALLNTHRPDAFEMREFTPEPPSRSESTSERPLKGARFRNGGKAKTGKRKRSLSQPLVAAPDPEPPACGFPAFRYFRPALPACVELTGKLQPARVAAGEIQGSVLRSSGPWRSSGEWWQTGQSWGRDEWDILLHNGGLYRLYRDRLLNSWFVEGSYD